MKFYRKNKNIIDLLFGVFWVPIIIAFVCLVKFYAEVIDSNPALGLFITVPVVLFVLVWSVRRVWNRVIK